MDKKENVTRRDALKRMSKTAIAVAAVAMFPHGDAFANNSKLSQIIDYTDRCYDNYGNYDNYSNHNDYSNYDNYKNYTDYKDICR